MAASKELITKIVLKAQADGSISKAFSALTKNSDTCIGKLAQIGDKAKSAFKVVGTAAAVGAAAVIGIGKAAIDSYAEYEQLVGGVETLFKDSADKLIEYSNVAYKTAGLSSNEYMSTITSFSATMINSLGGDTAKATEYSNQAVIDMSDNANKMGTDMESIMNTYQSLSRGQFGMLDNLKLGYGGTKKEAERLLADAQKITGIKYDISSFSDVTQAIHVIQEKMGITGTTAKEASTTIQGSWSALSGAWKNLMTGLADPSQDLGLLIQNVFDSAMTFFNDNLMPRIKEVMPRIASAIKQFSPIIGDTVSALIPPLIPVVVEGASAIINAVVSNLPKIFSSLMGALPSHISGILTTLAGAFAVFKISGFITTVGGAVKELKTLAGALGITGKITAFANSLKGLSFAQKLAAIGQAALNAVMSINPVFLIVAAIAALIAIFVVLWNKCEGFRNFWIGLWEGIKTAASAVGNWLKNFFTVTIPNAFNAFVEKCKSIWTAIENFFTVTIPNAFKTVITFFQQLPSKIGAFFQKIPYMIGYCIGLIIGKIILFGQKLWSFATVTIPQFITKVIEWFKQLPGKIWTWLVNVVTKIGQWAVNMGNKMRTAAVNAINAVVNWFAQLPSRLWTWLVNVVSKIGQWGSNMVAKAKEVASNTVNAIINFFKNLPSKMLEIGKNIVQGLWNGINNAKDWLIGKIKSFASGITDGIKAALGINSPSVVMEKLFKWVPIGAGNGILNNAKYAINAVKSMGGKIANTASKVMPTFGGVSANLPKHGTGGTFTSPHAAIVGDRPETIVPHGNTPRNRALLSEAAKGVGASGGGNVFQFTFAPVIHGGNAEANRAMLHDEETEFERRMEAWLARNRRLAY